jgi:hypothetical protein
MNFTHRGKIAATSLFVMVAVMQTYLGVSFAARASVGAKPSAPQDISGILTTGDNKPITVNGSSAVTGATILNGATIETPDQVSATIRIPGHGSIEITPNTKFTLEIGPNGNLKVNLMQGCLTLYTMKGTSGEVDNAQGVIGKIDPVNDGKVDTCSTKVAGAAAGGGGLGTKGAVLIAAGIGGGVTALYFGLRGSDPSPSTPQ